ncbi:MAG: thiamine pyrophosphate-dependent enzyme [Alphaproteobacteria bacterium]|nr:thiamine pyrophosphate-dependent enzyme [Alphaproteobacteria bacterium]
MAQLKRIPGTNQPAATLDRRDAVPALIERPTDWLVVAGLAGTAQELCAMTDDGPNVFGLGGAMGAGPMMALGLALSQPNRKVLGITGDGELLMNVGALAAIALQCPPNLKLVCVDNGHYGETGNQDSHTGLGVALDRVAAGFGIPTVHTINTMAEIEEGKRILAAPGLAFILLRVKDGPALKKPRSLRPHVVRDRFRAALLGEK